ncbi:hypothetical protein DVH24_037507 [Malus domestica]|uniref:NADH:quinone oxidoreductase/Mrp antiporter transmembrane domain-containing protein n=1 Tax=Malus domestica TaxID=3750 RepID=A0A498KQZ6_MALDO|nr:hypothetical protein DVH24_037507 [Malus domestica]
MVTRHPWRGTLQYLYAFSRNLIKNGSVWIGSDQYGIITPRPFYILSLVDYSRHNSNNLCSFNISRSANWFYKRYRTQRSHFTNNLSRIYWRCAFFLAGTSYDRIRLVYLDEMGGMAIAIPKIFTTFSILSMASLALPGMSGFVAELLVFFGILTSQKYLLMTKILITFVMAIGMILTPIYSLSMLRQMFYGYKLLMPQTLIF